MSQRSCFDNEVMTMANCTNSKRTSLFCILKVVWECYSTNKVGSLVPIAKNCPHFAELMKHRDLHIRIFIHLLLPYTCGSVHIVIGFFLNDHTLNLILWPNSFHLKKYKVTFHKWYKLCQRVVRSITSTIGCVISACLS